MVDVKHHGQFVKHLIQTSGLCTPDIMFFCVSGHELFKSHIDFFPIVHYSRFNRKIKHYSFFFHSNANKKEKTIAISELDFQFRFHLQ